MWINTQLAKQENLELAHVATVVSVERDSINAVAHTQTIGVEVATPYGVKAMPSVGDEVVLVPTVDGKYICVGKVCNNAVANELSLSAPSGAEIVLKADGSISLNGLVISKEGVLLGN